MLIVVCLVCFSNFFHLTSGLQDNKTDGALRRLIRDLFDSDPPYNPNIRPARDWRNATKAKVQFGVIQLHRVLEVEKVLEASCYLDVKWFDDYLKWNPDDYDGIKYFRYPYKLVWKPEFMLYNTPDLDDKPTVDKTSTNLLIRYDGRVLNKFIALYKAACPAMDMTFYPFDSHRCYFRFGSWTYSGNEIDWYWRHYPKPESLKFIPSSEWLFSIVNYTKTNFTECCPNETYQFIDIYIRLQRKPLYYLFNLVLPTVIICLVAVVGMFSPTSSSGERTEKMNLGMAALLSLSILMLTVSQTLPVNSDNVTIMSWFLQIFVIMIALAMLTTVVVLAIDNQGAHEKPVPQWAQKYLVERLGPLLGVSKLNYVEEVNTMGNFAHCVYHTNARHSLYPSPETDHGDGSEKHYLNNNNHNHLSIHNQNQKNHEIDQSIQQFPAVDGVVQNQKFLHSLGAKIDRVDSAVRRLLAHRSEDQKCEEARQQWSRLATVVERIFLTFFLISVIALPLLILFVRKPSNNTDDDENFSEIRENTE